MDEAAGVEGDSACSETRSPGTLYSSLTQWPRSTSLQRSEQNGRCGLSFHSTGFLQLGHFIIRSITKPLKAQDLKFSFNCSRFPTPYEHYSPIGIDRTFAALGVQAHGDVLVYRSNNGSTFVLRKTAQSETPTDKSNSGKDPPLVSPLAQRTRQDNARPIQRVDRSNGKV